MSTKIDPIFVELMAQNGILEVWEDLKTDFKNGEISREFLIEKITKITIAGGVLEQIKSEIQNKVRNEICQTQTQKFLIPKIPDQENSNQENSKTIRQKIEKIVQINQNFGSNYQNKTIDKTIIIGNGDVLSLESAFDKVCEFGLDGVMIARGIFHNPWLFGGIDASLKSPKERVNLLIFHLNLWQKTWQNGKNYQSLKKYFKIYIQGFAGAVELRAKLMETDKIEKAIEISTNYLENC